MFSRNNGYNGVILDIDLSSGRAEARPVSRKDTGKFLGGRGLGMKILRERIKKPGLDPLSPENPLLFMPGPFSGFPPPASSRTCVVTKSPHTSPVRSEFPKASTVTYSNIGGFFGPEIRFAGYDGIVVTGRASSPAYVVIEDDRVEIRDAGRFWGMGTDEFDRAIIDELGDRGFRTCCIGRAGENLVEYACVISTAARAAGRGGAGCVMGSKNLKAIAVKGTGQPDVGDHRKFLTLLEDAREALQKAPSTEAWRKYGTARALALSSGNGTMAVKNYREGTFQEVDKIDAETSLRKVWVRSYACFCCPLACKKSGVSVKSPFAGLVHDGPEYETGTMLGANLMISDLEGMLKAVRVADDYGIDIISCGNTIGFMMEAYEKKLIDRKFLDGIDLTWGNVRATIEMIHKIAKREGIGELASHGVKRLSEEIGGESHKFAIHVKGQELAAWNVHADPGRAVCYATANRGACHLNGKSKEDQDLSAVMDSLGVCRFAAGGYGHPLLAEITGAITGREMTMEEYAQTGERIFNLEKMFNYREGFRRRDDSIPERFFEEPLTTGDKKGAVIGREEFRNMMDSYYSERGWDIDTTQPLKTTLVKLGLGFLQ